MKVQPVTVVVSVLLCNHAFHSNLTQSLQAASRKRSYLAAHKTDTQEVPTKSSLMWWQVLLITDFQALLAAPIVSATSDAPLNST